MLTKHFRSELFDDSDFAKHGIRVKLKMSTISNEKKKIRVLTTIQDIWTE